jgi:hypothetical protein
MVWATFWAIFSQTHLVTLIGSAENLTVEQYTMLKSCHVSTRVARWFIFQPKIPIWDKFWRALEWNRWLVYSLAFWYKSITAIWYIFGHFVME